MTLMRRWIVYTPEYGTVIPIVDGQGPMEYGCDVIEIEAESRRDALLLGVKAMRQNSAKYRWYRDVENPFAGVRVEPVLFEEQD